MERSFRADEDNQSPYKGLEIVEDSFDRAAAEDAAARDMDDYLIDLYDYVGAYYGWSWKEFKEVPVPIIKKFKKKIDSKLENMEDEIFSYQYLAVIMALAKAFGGK